MQCEKLIAAVAPEHRHDLCRGRLLSESFMLLFRREEKPQAAGSSGDAAESGAADDSAAAAEDLAADKPVEETLQQAEEQLSKLSTEAD